jgi:hypothetical protein
VNSSGINEKVTSGRQISLLAVLWVSLAVFPDDAIIHSQGRVFLCPILEIIPEILGVTVFRSQESLHTIKGSLSPILQGDSVEITVQNIPPGLNSVIDRSFHTHF